VESCIGVCSTWVSGVLFEERRVVMVDRHFGCCLGDTLASELGILSRSPPVLVTTFKRVPPGTNGAISVGGTLASMVGGLIMGGTVGVCLVVENGACRAGWVSVVFGAVSWGGFAGLFGSFVSGKVVVCVLC
jgi:uncharacterized membrane protein